MTTRRELLASILTAAPILVVPRAARGADGSYDVSYLWSKDLESVLDYRELVATVLGDEVSSDLVVVRGGSGNWGLLYDRRGSDPVIAAQVARKHHRALHGAFGTHETLATMIPDRGFSHVHHVRFGIFDDEFVAEARYNRVAAVLGKKVHQRLVIEHTGMTTWQVVERRYASLGDLKSSLDQYAQDLPDVPVDTVEDRNAPLWWGPSSGTPDPDADDYAVATPSPVQAEAAAGAQRDPSADGQASDGVDVPSPPAKSRPLAVTESTPSPQNQAPKSPRAKPGTGRSGGAGRPRTTAGPARVPGPSKPVDAPVIAGNEFPGAVKTHLRDSINEYVQQQRRRGRVTSDERTSWYVHTLHDDRTWCAINADRPLQSASMVKPFVALAFLHLVARGRFVYGPRSRANLEAMIQESSNASTNWAIAQVGGPRQVQAILERHYGDLFSETTIVEGIPRYGRAYRNRSSARDYVRFCRALWRNELPQSRELRRLMALPGRDRLATDVKGMPQTTEVLNKTGTTSHLCGDFGILVVPSERAEYSSLPYALVGIIEKRRRARSFTSWSRSRAEVIRNVSALVYRELKTVYPIG